jgi:hypothetical protein
VTKEEIWRFYDHVWNWTGEQELQDWMGDRH